MIQVGAYPAMPLSTIQNLFPVVSPVIAATPVESELAVLQDSLHPSLSSTLSAPPSISDHLSTSNVAETDLLSSSTTAGTAPGKSRPVKLPSTDFSSQTQGSIHHTKTPSVGKDTTKTLQNHLSPSYSTLLQSSPTQGSKRTADGSLKNIGLGIHGSVPVPVAHKRNKSGDTHSGTRIGELSAQLKTRLSYAMVKVQNGWEKRSFDELEEEHSQLGSPSSVLERSERLLFDSPHNGHGRRRPSGVSDNSDPFIASPASDSAHSHVPALSTTWHSGAKPVINATANLLSITHMRSESGPKPAPDAHMERRRRSSLSYAPPSLLGTSQRKHCSDLTSTPKQSASPRAGILRMPSQQAEKDAVDTLLFMSSPSNSQHFPSTTHVRASPLRPEAPQRRVMFEAYPQEKHVVYQPSMPAPTYFQHESYPAYPARHHLKP